jgi:hypothetical protein
MTEAQTAILAIQKSFLSGTRFVPVGVPLLESGSRPPIRAHPRGLMGFVYSFCNE